MTDVKRYGLVTGASSAREVAAYLPDNYHLASDSEQPESPFSDGIYIEGVDRAGWTLDAYVIPRLLSGNMGCKEMFLWGEEDGDPENGPHVTFWFEDEPQTAEAMARRQADEDLMDDLQRARDEEREERSYIYRGIE